MKRNRIACLILTLCSLAAVHAQNGAASEKRHIFVILDISGSMNEQSRFAGVKEYLERDVFEDTLRAGDSFTLITFGDSAKEVFTKDIASESDRTASLEILRNLKADAEYTDIGTAMETLFNVLSGRERKSGRDIILFITDGKNAPPPDSPYFGKDIALDARFQDIGRKISQNGWFLYVIGIGDKTDAQTIAEAVVGSVVRETDENLADVQVTDYIEELEQAAKMRAETENTRGTGSASVTPADGSVSGWGFSSLAVDFSTALGIPVWAATVLLILVPVLLLGAIIIVLFISVRKVEIRISDNLMGDGKFLSRSISLGSSVVLNSGKDSIPSIGEEKKEILSIEKGFTGLRLRINDETLISPKSDFHRKGTHPFKGGTIQLANGNHIRVTVRR